MSSSYHNPPSRVPVILWELKYTCTQAAADTLTHVISQKSEVLAFFQHQNEEPGVNCSKRYLLNSWSTLQTFDSALFCEEQ